MKRSFHSELREFSLNLVKMSQKASEAVALAIDALFERDAAKAQQVIDGDSDLDKMEIAIDQEAIRYISLRAPVASDLRLLMVGTKTSHDLERVGDEASSICKRILRLCKRPPLNIDLDFAPMCDLTRLMLKGAMDSFLEENEKLAEQIVIKDRIIDNYHYHHLKSLTDHINRHPEDVESAIDTIFISKSIERIADHATNVAEEVSFLLKGEDIRHSPYLKTLKKNLGGL